MSVDTLRENFHINRISSDLLQDFLTAQTYRPEITLAKEKLLKLPHTVLQNLCNKPIRQGKSPKYAEKGLKCIKPRNTVDLLVSLNDIDYIDPSTENDISNQCLAYGDIVITRSGSGTIGRASIFSFNEKIYTNDHLFIVRVSKADSHYVVSFLKSYYGARLLEAGISGSTAGCPPTRACTCRSQATPTCDCATMSMPASIGSRARPEAVSSPSISKPPPPASRGVAARSSSSRAPDGWRVSAPDKRS